MLDGGSLVGNESASVLSKPLSRAGFSSVAGRSSGSRRLPECSGSWGVIWGAPGSRKLIMTSLHISLVAARVIVYRVVSLVLTRGRRMRITDFGAKKAQKALWLRSEPPNRPLLPARRDTVFRVLLIQPLLQCREIIEDGGGIHLALASQRVQLVRPRLALTHLQHLLQTIARNFIVVDGTAVQRTLVSDGATQPTMKLELENV